MPADDRAQSSPVLLRRADQVLSHAEDGLNLIAALAIFFLMFVGVAQIVGRTVFDFAIYGYIDWIEQASVLFAFLGIAYAQRLGSHIGMDLTMGWQPRNRWKIELFGVAMTLAIITVLIYASFTFIFFALEAAVMAYALELAFDIPPAWGYGLCALIVIPLVSHGVTAISRLQVWTQPLWLALLVLPLVSSSAYRRAT